MYNCKYMKTLKLDHALAKLVLSGEKTSTWRINDDKNLSVNDDIELIDKVDPVRPDTWRIIGVAKIDNIIEKRLGEVEESDYVGHGEPVSKDELIDSFRPYYGEEVNEDTPVKMVHFSFSAYEHPVEVPTQTTKHEKVKLYADGGSRGNPGQSASGYVLLDEQDVVLKKSGVYLGITTNNQAEYQALKFGLEEAQKMGAQEVDVYMDSLLVVNQMRGIFKVKNRDLWPVHESVKELVGHFHKVNFTHVPRELNRLADQEVNETLDAEQGDQ